MNLEPTSPKELCEALASAAASGKSIQLGGNFSKDAMGGPIRETDIRLTTSRLTQILQYEPSDLTLSVEAGCGWQEVCRVLDEHHQMIPLDPPYSSGATVGGVIATNGSGPRRRLYGAARDLVIGMRFATLEGKQVQSGGMVVKNVAGLDMGKLMIGSYGTLAAISVVNFKLTPKPEVENTSLLDFDSPEAALAARDGLIRGVLQPSAVDLLNPGASEGAYLLAVQYGGNQAAVERYRREIGGTILEAAAQQKFWQSVIDYSQVFTENSPDAVVVRISSTLSELQEVFRSLSVPAISRAASGVTYAHFPTAAAAEKWLPGTKHRPWRCVIEFSPLAKREALELWPAPGDDFGIMKSIKRMFDPKSLLNHGRLYRLI